MFVAKVLPYTLLKRRRSEKCRCWQTENTKRRLICIPKPKLPRRLYIRANSQVDVMELRCIPKRAKLSLTFWKLKYKNEINQKI